jgi:hypothetical protein
MDLRRRLLNHAKNKDLPMQLLLNLPEKEPKGKTLTRNAIKRGVAQWFWNNQAPDAMALEVPTKNASLKVDIAAIWNSTKKTKVDGRVQNIIEPAVTAIVITSISRKECWPECSNPDQIIKEITATKKHIAQLEANIREREPNLRERGVLFEEFATWNYERTTCKEYHREVHRLQSLESMLFKGTKLARVAATECASLNYLAVPENTISPIELIDGWGLFYVNIETEEARLIKPPTEYGTTLELKQHLAINMLVSSTKQVNDAIGIRLMKDQSAILVKPPTFHKK